VTVSLDYDIIYDINHAKKCDTEADMYNDTMGRVGR